MECNKKLKIEEVEDEMDSNNKNNKITYCYGNIIKKQEQKDGIVHGLEIRYHLNGETMSHINYINGEKDGVYSESNSEGKMVKSGYWMNGVEYVEKDFFKDGTMRTEIDYLSGKGSRYNQDSSLDFSWADMGMNKIGFMKNTDNGKIEWVEFNGKKEGLMIESNDDGQIISKTKWKSGRLNGKNIYFYDNGFIKNELIYDKGVKSGASISYYEGGEVEVVCNYSNNLLEGRYMKFNQGGDISMFGDYRYGKEQYQGEYRKGKLVDISHHNFMKNCLMYLIMITGINNKKISNLKKQARMQAPSELKQ